MTKKFQKKLLKAIRKKNCEKVIRLCTQANCGAEMTEELIFRAMFYCGKNKY